MKKRILVDVDTVAFLRKAFNVSRATVWRRSEEHTSELQSPL